MATRWLVTMFLINIVEVIVTLWFLHRRLELRDGVKPRVAIGFVVLVGVLFLLSYYGVNDVIKIAVMTALGLLYTLFMCRGTLREKAYQILLASALLGATSLLVAGAMTVATGAQFSGLMAEDPVRLEMRIAARILFIGSLYFVSRKREQSDALVSLPGWIAVIAIPLIGTVAVGAIARYEYLHSPESPELFFIAMTIFLLIGAILMLFHGLLEYIRSSFEKEMQLRQSEQQGRYFSEIQVAAENIRGLKHDINNHLQVLGSFLEMGKVDEASAYIAQISDFVKRNDIAVRSGNALVDAVLGSKLAKAIRFGIDVDYSIDITEPIDTDMMLIGGMLGNLLDNAIEACQKIHTIETDRYIFLTISLHGGMLHVTIKNTREAGASAGDLPPKAEAQRGLGLVNVRRTVEKFRGSMSIQEAPGEYTVKIQMPYRGR